MLVRALSCLAVLAVPFAGCEPEVTPRLAVSGFDREAISVDVKLLGRLDEEEVKGRAAQPGIDGVQRVPAGTCDGPCRFAEVSVYIQNHGGDPAAPPVVRVDAPLGSPPRTPLALGAKQIDPGRTGRIRFIVELYPKEEHVDVRLSSSVFIDMGLLEPPAVPVSSPGP